MGNQVDSKGENKNEEDKNEGNRNEVRENLESEEIPPDTQINNEYRETHENEQISENQNQLNQEEEQPQQDQQYQQNNQEEQMQPVQETQEELGEEAEAGGEEEIGEEQVGEEGEPEGGGEPEAGVDGGEAEDRAEEGFDEGRGEGDGVQGLQQQYQMPQGQQNLQGQQYQFVQDGQLYQVDENGQIYKVIQEVQNPQEEGMNAMGVQGQMEQGQIPYQNQMGGVQYAQPIFQNLDQYQQIQQSQQFMGNMEMQQNAYQMTQANYENYEMQKGNLRKNETNTPSEKLNMMSPNSKSMTSSNRFGRTEPKDSIPKMHIISNRGSKIKSDSSNFMKFKHNKKKSEKIFEKGYYTFGGKRTSNQFVNATRDNPRFIKSFKNFNRVTLKNKDGFVEIPRSEYDNYLDRETLVINDGMDTGEYKFIGAKTHLKEGNPQFGKKYNLNEEDIIQEINRRTKAGKEKKVSYEIVDKFYALTEIRGKTIKRLEKKAEILENKMNFYSTFENNDYNTNLKMNEKMGSERIKNEANSNENYYVAKYSGNKYNSNIQGSAQSQPAKYGDIGRENYIVANFKVGNSSQSKSSFQNINFKASARSSGAIGPRGARVSDGYYEFRREIPIRGRESNYTNFNNRNSITSKPTDNYSKYILEQINKIRIDPQSFIGVIEDAKTNISKDKFGRIIYNGKMRIALANGESSFDEAIEFLKNADSMEPLQYISYLTVMPPQNEKEIKDKDDLSKKVIEMINGGINIKSYWRDVIKDPEISFLLMIVDDNGVRNGMRRKDIMNPNIKYIGISSIEINRNFVCYITLS